MLRPRSLERKLFAWLAVVAVVPVLAVLLIGLTVGSRSLRSLGTLGPWASVAESGRAMIEAAEAIEPGDTALVSAAARHREVLSESLRQAGRWSFLEERIAAAVPIAVAVLAVLLAALALLVARRLSRELSRPIAELVDWAGRLGRGEPLPAGGSRQRRDVSEVATLRKALRSAEAEIGEGKRRALETERTRVWGEMARRVAHEMKNPLTPLRLAAHRLGAAAESDPALDDVVTVIREETTRLDDLARSFATLGKPVLGPASDIDLGELLRGLLDSDVPAGVQSSVHVGTGTSMIRGDYEALARAFRNVVRNAVESTGGDANTGVIEVRVSEVEAGEVEVVVGDDGAGIPEGQEDVIFEPDRTLKPGGTGLGLAVVRQVVAAHGGQVFARSRSGGGAEFVVRLPRAGRLAGADEPNGEKT